MRRRSRASARSAALAEQIKTLHGRGARRSRISALPAIIRPSFTLGGTGGGIAYNKPSSSTSSSAASTPRPPTRC